MRSLLYQKIQQISEDKFVIKEKDQSTLSFEAPLYLDFRKRSEILRNRIIFLVLASLAILILILIFLLI